MTRRKANLVAGGAGDGWTVQVVLVYEQADPEGPEHLAAVLTSEADAQRLHDERQGRKVSWETHRLRGGDEASGEPGEVVYVVSLGGLADAPDESTDLDPIGLGVFARREEAERFANEEIARLGAPNIRVRSLPLGWRSD